MSLFESSARPTRHERPTGVTALAIAFALASLLLLAYTAAISAEMMSFTRAAWLIGEGVARMGVAAIALSAVLSAFIAFGLFRTNRFARWAAIIFLGYGLLEAAPGLIAALNNFSPVMILEASAQFISRTIALWYLFQAPVREAFD
ncbi:MAG TPA: hypothetical protein VMU24_00670 [Candidatus Acidoferrales bacterium]|nr:hypothetical protein [Candidatus Acidoferrales bacterium]